MEAILNSRPLTPLSSDPNDLLPLSPGHFLTGRSLTSLPEDDFRFTPENRLSCWQIAQKLKQHFWERWHHEYLNELIPGSKWTSNTNKKDIRTKTHRTNDGCKGRQPYTHEVETRSHRRHTPRARWNHTSGHSSDSNRHLQANCQKIVSSPH